MNVKFWNWTDKYSLLSIFFLKNIKKFIKKISNLLRRIIFGFYSLQKKSMRYFSKLFTLTLPLFLIYNSERVNKKGKYVVCVFLFSYKSYFKD